MARATALDARVKDFVSYKFIFGHYYMAELILL